MWETKDEGGCPSIYEVLGLLGRQAGGGGRVSVRPALDPRVPVSGSQTSVQCDQALRARPGLHLHPDAVLAGSGGHGPDGDLASALSLPDLPAPPAHADPERRLDAYSSGPAAHRVYLPIRPRDAEGRRSADHRP